jgi:hypothetical protein
MWSIMRQHKGSGMAVMTEGIAKLPMHNGYPVPFIAYRGPMNRPEFAINDNRMVMQAILGGLCAICGEKLNKDAFLLGGIRSALDPRGCYRDPPMHQKCAEYALRVCPWLALPSYVGVKESVRQRQLATGAFVDMTVDPRKPSTFFMVKPDGMIVFDNEGSPQILPNRPMVYAEEWREGVCLRTYTAQQCATELRFRGLAMLKEDKLTVAQMPKIMRDSWAGKLRGRTPRVF